MNKALRIFFIILLVAFLAAIRGFSIDVFYDPLILFFEHDYLSNSLPEMNSLKLIINLFFRYLLNSIVSLAIIYFVFLKRDLIIFSIWIFIIGFFLFVIPFYLLMINYQNEDYLLLFYIRRFLIQPLLLLLLLPAFYYQKITDN